MWPKGAGSTTSAAAREVRPRSVLRTTGAGAARQSATDNSQTLGAAANRWSVVYAGTGTINTSDAREKTPVRPLTASEIAAARSLSAEIGVYQWLDMIEEKGADEARLHIGMTVQRAIEIINAGRFRDFQHQLSRINFVTAQQAAQFRQEVTLLYLRAGEID